MYTVETFLIVKYKGSQKLVNIHSSTISEIFDQESFSPECICSTIMLKEQGETIVEPDILPYDLNIWDVFLEVIESFLRHDHAYMNVGKNYENTIKLEKLDDQTALLAVFERFPPDHILVYKEVRPLEFLDTLLNSAYDFYKLLIRHRVFIQLDTEPTTPVDTPLRMIHRISMLRELLTEKYGGMLSV